MPRTGRPSKPDSPYKMEVHIVRKKYYYASTQRLDSEKQKKGVKAYAHMGGNWINWRQVTIFILTLTFCIKA